MTLPRFDPAPIRTDGGLVFTPPKPPAIQKAESLWRALLSRAQHEGPFSEVMDVTPELAKVILNANPQNRRWRGHLASITRDVRDGRWELNGEQIIISATGELNDGQHRLKACADAGVPIRTFVAFGLTRESRMTVDSTQATRTPGDFLAMDGMHDTNVLAAAAGYLWQIVERGEIPVRNEHKSEWRPTKSQIREFVGEHGQEISAVLDATPDKGSRLIASRAVLAAARLLLERATDDPAAVDVYFRKLVTGAEIAETDPVFVTRSRLIEDKRRRASTPHRIVELIIRGWNATRRGESYRKAIYMAKWPKIAR